MAVFRIVEICLILLGTVSGGMLLLSPKEVMTFWLLYALSFVGGFILFSLGSQESSPKKVLSSAGGILLILGLLSAISIFFGKVNIIETKGTFSL